MDQKLKIRLDSVNSKHTRCTIFMDGANCGKLCMLSDDWITFTVALKLGAKAANLLIEVENNEGKLFSDD